MNLPRLAVERPVTTAMALTACVGLGAVSVQRLPLQFLPEFAWPSATVVSTYRGSSPEETDRLIVRPLEDRLATLPHLKSLQSTATANGANTRLEFAWSTDMDLMSIEIRERLDLARADLPDDLPPIRLMRFSTADFSVVHLNVAWQGARDELEHVIETRVVPALQRLDGVAAVEVHGLTGVRLLVKIDRDRLEAHGVDAFQVSRALQDANVDLAAGTLEHGGREWFLRVVGRFHSVEEIAALPIGDGTLRLSDVATVELGFPERQRVQRLDGHDSVLVEVYKETTANMVDVARGTREAVAGLLATPGLEPLDIEIVRDRSIEVVTSLTRLRDAGAWGAVLAALVLFLFLRQVRSTLIVVASIPASIMVTLAITYCLHASELSPITLNLISLTGLMLAVGMLVDNGVVVLENIYRLRRSGASARDAALHGASEVSRAVVTSTITTVIVFASTLGGFDSTFGRWRSEFGVTMTCALLASLAVALSFVPMAAARLFRRPVRETTNDLPRVTNAYQAGLGRALRWRWAVLIAAAGIAWGSWELMSSVDRRPTPRAPQRQVTVDVLPDRSWTMEQLDELFGRLEETIEPHRERLGIEAVVTRFGISRRRSWETRASVRLFLREDGPPVARVKEEIRTVLPEVAGVSYRFERLRHWSGNQEVGVDLSGRDPQLLSLVAEDVRRRLASLPDLADVQTNLEAGDEELRMTVDRTVAAERGVRPLAVARAVSAALGERPITEYRTSERDVDVIFQLEDSQRARRSDIEAIEVRSEHGGHVKIGTLTTFAREPGPRMLRRQDRRHSVSVTGEPAPGSFFAAGGAVRDLLNGEPLPAGIEWKMGRTFSRFQRDQAGSLATLGLAIVLVYLAMASLFESFLQPLAILTSIPFALTGVAVLYWFTSTPLDAMAYLGFMVLAGLVVNNGILLVDTANRLRRENGLDTRAAIIRAGGLRLRPILITTITTLAGLFPLVAPTLAPGIFGALEGRSARWAPLSLAVFGGLLTSTVLTLGVTPIVYSLLDDLSSWLARSWRAARPARPEASRA